MFLSLSCQVWYLIVSIFDVSFLFYFVTVTCCSGTTSSQGSAALLCAYVFVKLSFQDSNLVKMPSRRSASAILLLRYAFAKFHFGNSVRLKGKCLRKVYMWGSRGGTGGPDPLPRKLQTSSPMGGDRSPESQHNVWRYHN